MLKTLDQANIKGKKVLLRVGYDITLSQAGDYWEVPDDQRIKATLPTINYLLAQNCSIILMSWLGRPKPGKSNDEFKMDPVAQKLSHLLGRAVKKLDETFGTNVQKVVAAMQPQEIVMLENTRFWPGEQEADPKLAKAMATLAEFVVFDAFAQAHRIHASTTGILENHRNNCCAGLLMEKELKILQQILKGPMEPFIVVLGGAKVSDKIAMIRNILDKTGLILIGGALANPFFKAQGWQIGASVVEGTFVDQAKGEIFDPVQIARELLVLTSKQAIPYELIPEDCPQSNGLPLKKLQLPIDVVVAKKDDRIGDYDDKVIIIKKLEGYQDLCAANEAILDIGPRTAYIYSQIIKRARTIFWNGPMGYFEDFNFSQGTERVADAIAQSTGFSIIGGGDTEGVVTQFNLENQFGHVSTGGGAALALLAGEELPVLKYLET